MFADSRSRRTRRQTLTSLAALAALGLAVGCAAPSNSQAPTTSGSDASGPVVTGSATVTETVPATTDPATPQTLDGHKFVVTNLDQEMTMEFRDGQVFVSGSCNSLSGPVTYRGGADGNLLTVPQMVSTEMGCEQSRMDQDSKVIAFLATEVGWTLSGKDAVLLSAGESLELADYSSLHPDLELVGPTWTLEGLLDKDTASSVPNGVEASITLGTDGSIGVRDGCNTGGGTATIKGDELTVTDLMSTLIACDGDAGEVASRMAKVLAAEGPATFEITADQLTIMRGEDGLQFRVREPLSAGPSMGGGDSTLPMPTR